MRRRSSRQGDLFEPQRIDHGQNIVCHSSYEKGRSSRVLRPWPRLSIGSRRSHAREAPGPGIPSCRYDPGRRARAQQVGQNRRCCTRFDRRHSRHSLDRWMRATERRRGLQNFSGRRLRMAFSVRSVAQGMISPVMKKFACPCCGFLTLTDRTYWSFEICPVCFWENDPLQEEDPLYRGGANGISLTEGLKNFGRCGASHPDEALRVRAPGIDEVPTQKVPDQRRAKAQINSIARGIGSGEIPLLYGCGVIATLASTLGAEPELSRLLWMFMAVAEEVGKVEAGRYEAMVRDDVRVAAEVLREYLGGEFD